jgi:hypothetical protein
MKTVLLAGAFCLAAGMAAAAEPVRLDDAELDRVAAGLSILGIPINLGENGNFGIGNTGTNNTGLFNSGDGNFGVFNGRDNESEDAGNRNTGIFNGNFNTGATSEPTGSENFGVGNGNFAGFETVGSFLSGILRGNGQGGI